LKNALAYYNAGILFVNLKKTRWIWILIFRGISPTATRGIAHAYRLPKADRPRLTQNRIFLAAAPNFLAEKNRL
jgi:hypothetical protein